MGRHKKITRLGLAYLLDVYPAVREIAQDNIDNHRPVALEEETKRVWVSTLREQQGIPEEDALELLKEMPGVMKLAELCKAVA